MNDDKNPKITKIKKINKRESNDIDDQVLKNIVQDFGREIAPLGKYIDTSTNEKLRIHSDKNNLNQQFSKKISVNHLKNKPNKPVSEDDLMLSMTKRLNIVEKQLNEANKKLKELNESNSYLKLENEKLKSESYINKDQNLNLGLIPQCSNCKKLSQHIKDLNSYSNDLKEFIKEKGFVILKNSPILDNSKRLSQINEEINHISQQLNIKVEANESSHSEYEGDETIDQNIPKEIDINLISKRIEEMNILIYKDGNLTQFERDNDDKIFKLKKMKELKFYFYQNGLIIEGYKFYPFHSIEAKRILHDILDGYTPYILKNSYPDGALLQVINNLNKEYNKNITNLKNIADPVENKDKWSREEIMKSMPEKVIRNGKVYEIKKDMEQFFVIKSNNEYNLDAGEHYINFPQEEENEQKDKVCKLKVKIQLIDKIITINILKHEKIKAVFDFIQNFVNKIHKLKKKNEVLIDDIAKYVLYTNYPLTIFNYNNENSLEDNKLYPSHFLTLEENGKILSK